jgi:hypothetical protein
MRSSRALGVLAGTAAIALSVLTMAAPASAATLPSGQRITIIDALDDSGPGEGPFFTADPTDAAATPVGTGSGAYTYGLDVNDQGLGYAIGIFPDINLWKADANTGTVSDLVAPHFATAPDPYKCRGVDLNPTTGEVLVSCVQFTNETGNVVTIDSVDPATGLLTPLVTIPSNTLTFDDLALNPVTGVLWAFGSDTAGPSSYIVDRVLHTATAVATLDDGVNAADFDRDGQLFLTTVTDTGNGFDPSLVVADPSVGAFTSIGPFVNISNNLALTEVSSLSVWGAAPAPAPAPELAATGSSLATPVAIGSALLLLVGGAFIVTARLRSRRDA